MNRGLANPSGSDSAQANLGPGFVGANDNSNANPGGGGGGGTTVDLVLCTGDIARVFGYILPP